jgi:ABC-type spermidine/putrescine transport system permease subunit I
VGRALEQRDRGVSRARAWAAAGLVAPIGLVLVGFFVLPFLGMFAVSLEPSPILSDGAGFGAANYVFFFTDPYYLTALFKTLGLGVVVVALALILGYPCACFITQSDPRLRSIYLFIVVSPLLVSIVIRSFGWMVLLGNEGLVNAVLRRAGLIGSPLALMGNWTGVVIALTHVLLPYMILPIVSVLEGLDRGVVEAGRVLGATPWQAFRRVVLPLSLDGVAAGSILVFMLAVGSFATVLLLGGPDTNIVPLLIYQKVQVTLDHAFASSMGTVLLLIGIAILYLQIRLLRVRGLA